MSADIPASLDHLVVAGPDLAEAIDRIEELTGVRAAAGGVHPDFGTANALIALHRGGRPGRTYLEIIGPSSPGAPPPAFGIDQVSAPQLVALAIRPEDLGAAVADSSTGPARLGQRRTDEGVLLQWQLTGPPEEIGPLPFLIDWGQTPHPGLSITPSLELIEVVLRHPDPEAITGELAARGLADARIEQGEPGLRATVRGPRGVVQIT